MKLVLVVGTSKHSTLDAHIELELGEEGQMLILMQLIWLMSGWNPEEQLLQNEIDAPGMLLKVLMGQRVGEIEDGGQ